jgi:lipoprotein-releasing system permease protein
MQRINKWKADQGAFEVFVDDFNIKTVGEDVYQHTGSMLDTKTIIEKYSYIFEWPIIRFQYYCYIDSDDISCHINMVVALLVLILERTQMIGILKALG